MRLSLRFIIPLAVVLILFAYGAVPLVDGLTQRWFVRDLDIRSAAVASTMREGMKQTLAAGDPAKTLEYLIRVTQDERLYAIGFCDRPETPMLATRAFPSGVTCRDLGRYSGPTSHVLKVRHGPLYVSVHAVDRPETKDGWLVMVQDMSFIQRRGEETNRYVFYLLVALAATFSLITVVIAQLSWRGLIQGMRALLRGEGLVRSTERITMPELRPIEKDLRQLMREVRSDARVRDGVKFAWTPEAIRQILRNDLRGDDVLVVSNREPYSHVRRDGRIEVHSPASGLVTALEPIMRACSGTWIAHGSGSADREVVDKHDRVSVPPESPVYRIRRVWLTEEQEAGYYNGFANEGLWPLCHIAHVRPIFRTEDWNHYVAVNQKFARAVTDEARSNNPIVLVQDFHLALLPRMIRERMPNATIITFWHIPWPNPEAFAICPWRAEILDGLLGSSILGFHTQFHCNNFVDTVDRMLEARVDRESFTVSYGGLPTAIKHYPISIEWPLAPGAIKTGAQCRALVRERNGLPETHLIGIGIDRLDYTKGILERFRAVARLLEMQPRWVGKFSFIQIAAPSRSSVPAYKAFEQEVRTLASSINERFAGNGPPPIILKVEHHEQEQVYEYYRAAELCYVSSLHDGMNLVAKEFVASREDNLGVLVLSQFTGASRELPEALIVNPYDIEQCAIALHAALDMPESEQRERMVLMRELIREYNVYRWAGRMLLDAAGMRVHHRLFGVPRGVVRLLRPAPRLAATH